MKKFLFLLCILVSLNSQAQDYLSGKLVDKTGKEKEIFYDRTQNDITVGVYQTIYKVTDADKKPIYSVTLTHNRNKAVLFISIKPTNANPTARTVTYDKKESGLIFSDASTVDASFNLSNDYTHLFSFTDTMRNYPVLHKLKTTDGKEVHLDPLTKLRIRKHREEMKRIAALDPFNEDLFNLRDSLYAKHFLYTEQTSQLRKQIETSISTLMKDKQVEQDVKRYAGEKRSGKPNGNGLQVINGNIYSGKFEDGKFITGNVVLQNNGDEYCGQFKDNGKSGIGWLKYKNDSYLLGVFANNELSTGIALQKSKSGETYFGGYNGKRTGYGELQNNTGGKYAGEFSNDRLVKGYAKEVDQFGYYTYSVIERGVKTTIDAKTVEAFFGLTLSSNN
jgi:hypothetical protein